MGRNIRKSILAFSAALFGLLLVEIVLRLSPPKIFGRLSDLEDIYVSDPLLGHRLKPNEARRLISETGEMYTVETNGHGLRDGYVAGDGRRTILGLGDSFLFGEGVESDEGMAVQLQRLLDQSFPGRYRTINAGVPGYATNQEVLYYLTSGEQIFNPDVLLLFYFNNDLADVIEGGISMDQGIPPPDTAIRWAGPQTPRFQWQTGRFLLYCLDRLSVGRLQKEIKAGDRTSILPVEAAVYSKILYPSQRGRIRNLAIMLNILNLRARENGAKLIFVYVPSALETEEGEARKFYYDKYDVGTGDWDWTLPGRQVEIAVRSFGISFIDLKLAFSDRWRKTGRSLFFNGHGHFTPEGHRLAAETIAEELKLRMGQTVDIRQERADDLQKMLRLYGSRQSAGGYTHLVFNPMSTENPLEKKFELGADSFALKVGFIMHPRSDTLIIQIYCSDKSHWQYSLSPPVSASARCEVFRTMCSHGDTTLRIRIQPAEAGKRGNVTEPVLIP